MTTGTKQRGSTCHVAGALAGIVRWTGSLPVMYHSKSVDSYVWQVEQTALGLAVMVSEFLQSPSVLQDPDCTVT